MCVRLVMIESRTFETNVDKQTSGDISYCLFLVRNYCCLVPNQSWSSRHNERLSTWDYPVSACAGNPEQCHRNVWFSRMTLCLWFGGDLTIISSNSLNHQMLPLLGDCAKTKAKMMIITNIISIIFICLTLCYFSSSNAYSIYLHTFSLEIKATLKWNCV